MKYKPLTEEERSRIESLLRFTDMELPDIATRMGRSKTAIVEFNRKMKIRRYHGNRTHWKESDYERAG